ncbi:MAG: hypothetical protein E6471_25655, partial [Bradyrhizobium sp.]|nr:hypothetical protein [Bradyrhizobium sp.]
MAISSTREIEYGPVDISSDGRAGGLFRWRTDGRSSTHHVRTSPARAFWNSRATMSFCTSVAP